MLVLARLVGAALSVIVVFSFIGCRYRSSEVVVEQPPCRSCSQIYSSSGSIPTLEFCEFAANPTRYNGQLVRVRALFTNDAAQTTLSPPEGQCPSAMAMRTGLDEQCEACEGARKALTIYSGFETWYDSRAIIVAVGRTGRINNPKSYYKGEDGFNIVCLESVEPIGTGEAERSKYEQWPIF